MKSNERYINSCGEPCPWLISTEDEIILRDILEKQGFGQLRNFQGSTVQEKRESLGAFLNRFGISSRFVREHFSQNLDRQGFFNPLKDGTKVERQLSKFEITPDIRRGSTFIIDELRAIRHPKDITIIKDPNTGITDVDGDIVDNKLYSSSGARFDIYDVYKYLQATGSTYIRHHKPENANFAPSDRWFEGKEVYSGTMVGDRFIRKATHEVSDAVKESYNPHIKDISVITDDAGRDYLRIRPFYEGDIVVSASAADIAEIRTIKHAELDRETEMSAYDRIGLKYFESIKRGDIQPANILYALPDGINESNVRVHRIEREDNAIIAEVDGLYLPIKHLSPEQIGRIQSAEDQRLATLSIVSNLYGDALRRPLAPYYERYKELRNIFGSDQQVLIAMPEGKGFITFPPVHWAVECNHQNNRATLDGEQIEYLVYPHDFLAALSHIGDITNHVISPPPETEDEIMDVGMKR